MKSRNFDKNYVSVLYDELPKTITYRLVCGCGEGDHEVHIDLDLNEDFPDGLLTFYNERNWFDDNWSDNTIKRFFRRLKACLKLLFIGRIPLCGDIYIDNIEHLNQFILMLEECRDFMLKKQKSSEG